MNVKRFKSANGPDVMRHRTVIESDECVPGTLHSRLLRQEILRVVADDPSFTQCGGVDFQKARIEHNGSRWVAEFEALVQRPQS